MARSAEVGQTAFVIDHVSYHFSIERDCSPRLSLVLAPISPWRVKLGRVALRKKGGERSRPWERRSPLRFVETPRKIFTLIGAFSLALPPAVMQAQSPPGNIIHVGIAGLHNDKGQVLCALFSSAADFPKRVNKAVALAKSGIAQGHASCEFPGV